MKKKISISFILLYCFCFLTLPILFGYSNQAMAYLATDYESVPPFIASGASPLVMIVMGKNHKLYYAAYNDAADLNGDGQIDIKYTPSIDYFGYFDSYKQYIYNSALNRFEPVASTDDKKVTQPNTNRWSGDFLNYLTMTRMDCLRKVLYGGKRSTDTSTETVLERSFIPQDVHSWGKEYTSEAYDGYKISDYTPLTSPAAGTRHLFGNTTRTSKTSPPLLLILKNNTHRIWDWAGKERPVLNNKIGVGTEVPTGPCDIYQVYVQVGVVGTGFTPDLERFKKYGTGTAYKPVGLLQKFGEDNRMYFGLISGTYKNNLSGGVLRKNISSIRNEINPATGQFTSVHGIIYTINTFAITDYNYTKHRYNGGWENNHPLPLSNKKFPDWGNPLGEMLYEALKYFGGGTKTIKFNENISDGNDDGMNLPLKSWKDPYSSSGGNYDYCAKPFILAISDIYPTYDSDELPGSSFSSIAAETIGNARTPLNCKTLSATIFNNEFTSGSLHAFIGDNNGITDNSCKEKTIDSLGNIRGLCPEEPTKQGSYYSASIAYYGRNEDISTATGIQNVASKFVGLASPLPEINIKVGNKIIKLLPFGKNIQANPASHYNPTNTIAGFFVESLTETSGVFRINFEDTEQGADHDMDAICKYSFQVQNNLGKPAPTAAMGTQVEITIEAVHATSAALQHMGYIISGIESGTGTVFGNPVNISQDGPYLFIRDNDGKYNAPYDDDTKDRDYFLDMPNTPNKRLPITNTMVFIPKSSSTAATLLKSPLWYAAKWGNFEDISGGTDNIPDQQAEWDHNNDGIPDAYFYVQNPLSLEAKLSKSFLSILAEVASGTASSVISQTRSGEGAIYQAIFYPEYLDNNFNKASWVGDVHALFMDKWGNMREDTNNNAKLDIIDDFIIKFNGSNNVEIYKDINGDGIATSNETQGTRKMDGIHYIWSGADWLSQISDTDILSQRQYTSTDKKRYIFTFVDNDKDMVNDIINPALKISEQTAFLSATPTIADLKDSSKIFPYLTLFPSFNNVPQDIRNLSNNGSVFKTFLQTQTKREIDYIRGKDQGKDSTSVPGYTLPAFRNRQVNMDKDTAIETWRLGDVINSSPTVVGRPSEGYHLLYRDVSYAKFARHFRNRRQVIYVGGNDGMFHAFNGGFYNAATKSFDKYIEATNNTTYESPVTTIPPNKADIGIDFDLGAEMWAYIPYNLLPHLYWLTQYDYPHVYYNDLKPKIFDAKILPDDTHYKDNDTKENWGTFLIAGMRFGGGIIHADMDKTDHLIQKQTDDIEMTSSYSLFDITDPEEPPILIAELSFDGLGYTTCYPAVIPIKDKTHPATDPNKWYLVFGSGPADSSGKPGKKGIDKNPLSRAVSYQKSKLFIVDLKKLVKDHELVTINENGVEHTNPSSAPPNGINFYFEGGRKSFISDPISVDYDLDYKADVVYFGTVSSDGSAINPYHGKLRRVVINDDPDLKNWENDSILFETQLNQPIVAAPSVGIGDYIKRNDPNDPNGTVRFGDRTDYKNRWVFFGTGRFFVDDDKPTNYQQTYYGIKETFTPDFSHKTINWEWDKVTESDMLNVTSAEVALGLRGTPPRPTKIVSGISGVTDWGQLVDKIDLDKKGWYLNFSESRERNLGQAALFGDILTFTTYQPSDSICSSAGYSYLYALYYKTGTAYFKPVIGSEDSTTTPGDKIMTRKVSIGQGLALTPNIHVGYGNGTKAFIQKSTGEIIPIQQQNPGAVKSGVISWEPIP